jgi:hypothetical protein
MARVLLGNRSWLSPSCVRRNLAGSLGAWRETGMSGAVPSRRTAGDRRPCRFGPLPGTP